MGLRRLLAVAAIACLALLWGCVPQSEEHEADLGGPAPVPELLERAFLSPLHHLHLESKTPASCTDCHRIGDEQTKPPLSQRCMVCHEDRAAPAHARASEVPGRECLLCHDFLSPNKDPWHCPECHTGLGKEAAAADQLEHAIANPSKPARIIEVHPKEACSTCHTGHGPVKAELKCLECHKELNFSHRKGEAIDEAKRCLECHTGGHSRGKDARSQCLRCHDKTVGTHATPKGHDECVSCHLPHPRLAGMASVKVCKECHKTLQVIAADVVPKHADCRGCHDQHRARASARESCLRCHEKIQVTHKAPTVPFGCTGCHPVHSKEAPRPGKVAECSSCHEKASSDKAFHTGGVTCKDCHQPHQFSLEGRGTEVCASCHKGSTEASVKRRDKTSEPLLKDHQKCTGCHPTPAHAPKAERSSCASGTCHQEVIQAITKGHQTCTECHRPHSGERKVQCLECHAEKGAGRHQKAISSAANTCQACHRPHGPKGPTEPRECTSCHGSTLPPPPWVHQSSGHKQCKDCHNFHGKRPARGRTTCVGACHEKMTGHEPKATSCLGCHVFGESQ